MEIQRYDDYLFLKSDWFGSRIIYPLGPNVTYYT